MSISAIDKSRDTIGSDEDTAAEFFRDLTAERFLRLGVSSVVYSRSCIVDGDLAHEIHDADGALMSVVEDIHAATVLAPEYGRTFVAVH